MIAMFMGLILPKNEVDYSKDQNWRIVFAIPGMIATIQIVLYLAVVRWEPILYSISNDKEDDAKALIRKVYHIENDEQLDAFFNISRGTTDLTSSSVTLIGALKLAKFRTSTIICFWIFWFGQASGINVINAYATRLLLKLQAETNGSFPVKPLWGTYLLGFANFFWAFVALFTLNRFGRKTLLLFGQLGMTITLLIVGILLLTKHYITAYIFILLFVGCF